MTGITISDSPLWRVMTRLLTVVCVAGLGVVSSLLGLCLTTVAENATEIAVIKSDRLTSAELIKSFGAKIDGLQTEILKLPAEFPPSYFQEHVAKLEKRTEAIERSVHLIDINIAVIAEHLDAMMAEAGN